MVSKRKRPNMALMQEDAASADVSMATEKTHFAPRRSTRKAPSTGLGLYPDANVAEKENSQSGAARAGAKPEKSKRRKGVENAMNGLKEMEDNLRDAVKRQKMAVKSSSIMHSGDQAHQAEEDAAFLPKATKAEPDVIPSKNEKEQLTEKAKAKDEDGVRKLRDGGASDFDGADVLEPEAEDTTTLKQEGSRPPPVNSDYLPLPWKGRLGYVNLPYPGAKVDFRHVQYMSYANVEQACLNTYLRQSNPPVFSSRTCRIASIIEHRHPLQDPSQPEHSTKNRPDKDQPADVARGQRYVEALGLANARDVVKMLRWNDKYGIKFMRLSSEMFPFASHEEYGYKLAPFASGVLAEAGRVAGELGHRLTTHPGQFTQLGSPRPEVVRNAIRDLEYHDEMLKLLRLPGQANKDAVMILHMGGVFGDKAATLDRFRENYAKLSPTIKARLVLENDDVCWSVHDLLPLCEELNIPMVLDFHHHNIYFDADQIREGTEDIMKLYPRIKATWDKKGITQKMHYSEPCSVAITPRQRRKHSPRVMTLPPCPNDMDLMIEAKDKEQAVFNLMRNFKLPCWDRFNDVVPYDRDDENRPALKVPKKKKKPTSKKKSSNEEEEETVEEEVKLPVIPDEEVGMGGPLNRVYWPVGMEEWLRPKKREVKRKKKEEVADS